MQYSNKLGGCPTSLDFEGLRCTGAGGFEITIIDLYLLSVAFMRNYTTLLWKQASTVIYLYSNFCTKTVIEGGSQE